MSTSAAPMSLSTTRACLRLYLNIRLKKVADSNGSKMESEVPCVRNCIYVLRGVSADRKTNNNYSLVFMKLQFLQNMLIGLVFN